MIHSNIFPYLLSGGLAILITLLGVLIYFAVKKSSSKMNYDEQLEALMDEDDEDDEEKSGSSIADRWNRYWGSLLHDSGMARYKGDYSGAGRDVLFALTIIAVLTTILLQNPLIGIGLAILLGVGASFLSRSVANKKAENINLQLPGFLFALKANIQASETNERAMSKVITNMPSPLYEDLEVVKNKLDASATFHEALDALVEKTSSKDLRFLAVCMIQAITSGANLETQLDSIQRVLEQRRDIADEINRAVKSAQPAMWLATVLIPGLFLFSYDSARSFWFVEPISWFALIAVIGLYIGGMFMVKKQIDKIKNL